MLTILYIYIYIIKTKSLQTYKIIKIKMTSSDICFAELLFTIIDRNLLSKKHTSFMFKKCNYQQTCYINWLLNRWVILRDYEDHFPKKLSINLLKK